MREIDRFKLRPITPIGRSSFTPEWSITDDGGLLLIPKTEMNVIYVISTHNHNQRWEIKLQDRDHKPISPLGVHYVQKPNSSEGRLFVVDDDGYVWNGLIESLLRVREPELELFTGPSYWRSELGKPRSDARLNIWRVTSAQVSKKQYVFVLGYLESSDIRGCVRVADTENKNYTTFIYPIEEAPADITFNGTDQVLEILIATGRGGTVERYRWDGVHAIENFGTVKYPSMIKPSKIKSDPKGKGVWVVSYNSIFHILPWDSKVSQIQVTGETDAIADFDFSSDGTKIYATCLFSNRIATIGVQDYGVTHSDTQLIQPCWIKVAEGKIFVLGHSTETVTIFSL